MNKKLFYNVNVTICIFGMHLLVGCSSVQSTAKMREIESFIKKEKIQEVKPVLSIRNKKKYLDNEIIKFKIDTEKVEGYLYVLYLEKTGETGVIYPTKDIKHEKQSGELSFPQDFNNIDVRATKDCTSCEKEKTTIYVLLSDEPILEIESLNKNELLGLNSTPIKSRGLSLGNSLSSKVYIQKIDFFVE